MDMGSRYYFQVIHGDQSPSSGLFRNSSGFQFSSSPLPAGSSGAFSSGFSGFANSVNAFSSFSACQRTAGSSGPFSSGYSGFANSVDAFSSFSACQSTTPASSPTPTGPTNFSFGIYQQKKTNSSSGDRVPISETVVAPAFSFNIASSSVRRSNTPDSPESSPPPPPMDSSEKISPFGHDSAAETTNIPVIKLEVMVEKKKNRVVFAESNKDFIDLLFSFLTLPIGTSVNLCEDNSPPTVIGCMNNLYKSVENLDTQLLRTEACKEMLLQPKVQCRNLEVMNEGNIKPIKCYYFCQNWECRMDGRGILSEFANVRCHCGQVMNQLATLLEPVDAASCDQGEGGFLKGGADRFLVSDDLRVMPGLSSQCLMLLKNLSIVDAKELESQSMNIGPEEILQLLRSSLLSKTPLTHWILLKQGASDLMELELNNMAESLDKTSATSDSKKMSLKLFISKSREKVLYAEAGEDFANLLFSFLTFPLGSILKLLGGKSLLGCVDNLYGSVKDLSNDNYLKSDELKNMLLCPKLAPFFACENQLLHVEESSSPQYLLYSNGKPNNKWFVRPLTTESNVSSLGEGLGPLSVVNPKSSTGKTTGGGVYVKGPTKFMVTDALVVTQLSPISSISLLGMLDVPITDVDEKVVQVGEKEALNLLKAALISETALTDVFNLTDKSVLE